MLVGAADVHGMKLQAQFSRGELAFFPTLRGACILWIPQHCNTGELGNDFLEQLEAFAGQHRPNGGESRDVSTGPWQAINQPSCNRIRNVYKNNRDSFGSVFGGYGSGVLGAMIKSTLRRTSSSAKAGSWSSLPSAYRYSKTMFFPST